MSLRVIPALQFHYDDSVARGRYLSSLIDKAIAEDSTHEHHDETDSDKKPELSRNGDA
jgi:ribosome-binding factor A